MNNVQALEFCGIKGWPLCAVCKKPVEKMQAFDDINSYSRIYRAFCHGERQDVSISDIDLLAATEIKFNQAFDQQKLEQK